MIDHKERYLESALDELHHGGPDPELADRILEHDGRSPGPRFATGPRARRWRWLQAACVVLAIGLIALLLIPRSKETLPDTIVASGNEYEIRDGQVRLSGGWYLLETGAPAVTAGASRIEQVNGRVLVRVGEIPDGDTLQADREWLQQNGVENKMNLHWIKTGSIALCVLFGSAVVDGQLALAQEKEVEREADKPEDTETVESADELKESIKKLEEELSELRKKPEKNADSIREKEAELAAMRDKLAALETEEPDDDTLIDVDFVRKDLQTIMHYIALRSGLQLIVQGDMDFTITVNLRQVTGKEAVRAICEQHGLVMVEVGKVVFVKQSHVPAEKVIKFEFEGKLADAVEAVRKRTGMTIRLDAAVDKELEVNLEIPAAKGRQLLALLADQTDLELITLGETFLIRPALEDMTLMDLMNSETATRRERDSLATQRDFLTIAREGALEQGDDADAKQAAAKIKALDDQIAKYDTEIKALEGATAARD